MKELLICRNLNVFVCPSRQAGGQAGMQGWSCCTVSSGCVPPLGSTGASHSLDMSPGKGRARERRSGEPRAWRAVSLHWGGKSGALAPNSAHAPTVREDPKPQLKNLGDSVKMAPTTATDLGRGHLPWCGVSEEKPVCVCVCVVGNVGSVHQLEGAENCCLLPLDCLD